MRRAHLQLSLGAAEHFYSTKTGESNKTTQGLFSVSWVCNRLQEFAYGNVTRGIRFGRQKALIDPNPVKINNKKTKNKKHLLL